MKKTEIEHLISKMELVIMMFETENSRNISMFEPDRREQFENLFAAYHSLTAGAKSRDPKITALKIGTVISGLYAATMEVVTRLDKRTVAARAWTGREAGLRFASEEFHKALPELIA